MKKLIFIPILVLTVVAGLVFANRENKIETSKKSISEPMGSVPLSAAERNAARKKWETTPGGKLFKEWESSPAGKKVYASEAKIRKSIRDFTNMEAVITSLSLPAGSRVGFGMMVKISGEDFILSFGPLKTNDFQQLHSLKVNDKILLKSHSVRHAPKYTYPIISGDYVERDSKLIYNRPPRIGGC